MRTLEHRGALLLFLALASPASAEKGFVLSKVEATNDTGRSPTMALDAHGDPHIVYSAQTDNLVKYARNVDGVWVSETAASPGKNPSFTLDARGHAHVSFSADGGSDGLEYATNSSGSWVTETVDTTDTGENSIAIDALGDVHISYTLGNGAELWYARRTGGGWTTELVDTDFSGEHRIAVDADGNAHIAYIDLTPSRLRYASNATGSWSTEAALTTIFPLPVLPGIDIDDEGRVHISCTDNGLLYARQVADGWVADSLDHRASHSSLLIGSDGAVHIAYSTGVDPGDVVKYASNAVGAWTLQVVEDGITHDTSIAIDREGNPHIAYHDGEGSDLNYASAAFRVGAPLAGAYWRAGSEQLVRWDGLGPIDMRLSTDGGLTFETLLSNVTSHATPLVVPDVTTENARLQIVRQSPYAEFTTRGSFTIAPDMESPWWSRTVDASANDVGFFASMGLDPNGNPNIGYYDSTADDLKFARRSGGTWATEVVDAAGDVGQHLSLAFDPAGTAAISYHDNTNGDLKYAAQTDSSWTTVTLDQTGDVGSYSSLVFDDEGVPHVSYHDETNGDLEYAHRTGGVWTFETVDATGVVGRHSSLALDAAGRPCISYYDDVAGDLMFAWKDGTWFSERVDEDGNVGWYTSLAIDAFGGAVISYFDVTNSDLKVATKAPGSSWVLETVHDEGSVGHYPSLVLNASGTPHVSYWHLSTNELMYARRPTTRWIVERADHVDLGGWTTSLVLDRQGRARIAYLDFDARDLRYVSAAVEIGGPELGVAWPVGAVRTASWDGHGRVDLSLSVDGGHTWQTLERNLTGNRVDLHVPHAPSRFAKLRLEREAPRSIAESPVFTIESSVSLLRLHAYPASGGGVDVSWSTEPGPDDLGGYRVGRARGSGWDAIAPLTRETTLHDPAGTLASRYRLHAINGFGEALLLGDVSPRPQSPLDAWPLPYRGGELTVRFATAGGLGGGSGRTSVVVYDVGGRVVRDLVDANLPAGHHDVVWDGRDVAGRLVPSGVYFVRARGTGGTHELTVVRIR